ncbi:MAG: glutamate--tRNA ligase [Candidatus Krumholzibacteriia bacterium]
MRFAPSPTGFLHVGGVRTAIFNWLFARHTEGTFVLRIEDTDVARSTKESEVSLIDSLRWLGLDWDEGPDRGGAVGPYRQSERESVYRSHAQAFVEKGVAYPCFCTDDILRTRKEEARAQGRPPQYDGTCRSLGPGEIAERRAQGLPEAVRFRVPDEVIRFDDLIRGDVNLASGMVGDFVLLRSNGRPTYNFAAVVDDHAMNITHVLRGEEHLPNTLRQILIYHALGANVPRFGHLPLILAEDRSKLSKRHGTSSVADLEAQGYLPGAVVNYLALLGWSHPQGKEVLSMDELVESFSLDRVGKSAAVYDRKKLSWMNGQHIRRKPVDELFPYADRYFTDDIRVLYDENGRREILRLLQDAIENLADLDAVCAPFRSPLEIDAEALAELKTADARPVLASLAEELEKIGDDLTAPVFKDMMKSVGRSTGIKGKQLFFPVRAAITGAVHGPDLAGVAAVKGRGVLLDLIERAQSAGESVS